MPLEQTTYSLYIYEEDRAQTVLQRRKEREIEKHGNN